MVRSIILMIVLCFSMPCMAGESEPEALASLQSYTGILNMPNARVKPDWTMRLKMGYADPWAYYGGAVGFFDRFEFHGQFTRINTIKAFEGYGYGDYKDRSAGMRAVLVKENEFLPQLAVGFYDATGTGKFSSRYFTASKKIKNVDFTVGLGQGILAGEYTGSGSDSGESFLTSDPFRTTRVFGGAEWHVNPRLTLSAEYSSINRKNMFGYRDSSGNVVKADDSGLDINVGVKYKLSENVHATAAYLRGDTLAGSIDIEFPLKSEGFLAWKKTDPYIPGERLKWDAQEADNTELSILIAHALKHQGFSGVTVSCAADAVWVEFNNNVHLSNSRAFGHVADVCDRLMPQRITRLYLNIKSNNHVILSLESTRGAYTAFRGHKLDKEGFLAYSDLNLYKDENQQKFNQDTTASDPVDAPEDRFSFSVDPKISTFLNNRNGFFKHKGFLRARAGYAPWQGGQFSGELQWTLFNQFDEVDYDALETDNAVRTDFLDYEAESTLRLSMLALEQKITLPFSTEARVAVGAFESAYAGFGAEIFRYFNNGSWGLGFESELVRKRDPDNNFKLRDDRDNWYTPAFLHIYSQIMPSQGIEGGITMGRFLAGDTGFRIDLRRSFDYFTLGAWYTKTVTDLFDSPKNRGTDQKGVYISFPFSIFKDHDKPGNLNYAITSFTRDPGAMVRQPGSLYPMNPWSSPDHTRRTLDDMRRY